jgi:hypothetical protein
MEQGYFPCFEGDGWTFMATNILSLMIRLLDYLLFAMSSSW